jgi:predicted YcjX-like family ATPase
MGNCLLPGYENADFEQQRKKLVETFRKVFATNDGKVVLNAILYDLFYFTEATTDSEQALNQYAKYFIKERLGIKNTLDISNALISLVE